MALAIRKCFKLEIIISSDQDRFSVNSFTMSLNALVSNEEPFLNQFVLEVK